MTSSPEQNPEAGAALPEIGARIVNWAEGTLERLAGGILKQGVVPPFLAGHRIFSNAKIELSNTLSHLWKLGRVELAGLPITEIIRRQLEEVKGAEIDTFASYRTAEVLECFRLTSEAPLFDLEPGQLAELVQACDTTAIYDRATDSMPHRPANYAVVLLRAEQARRRLGIATDDELFSRVLAKVRRWMFETPRGFIDDDVGGRGRYDIYSCNAVVFSEPCAELVGRAQWRGSLERHVQLVEEVILANGASFAWGRSAGALSLCLTFEILALGLREGVIRNKHRAAALLCHALRELEEWFDDSGLINAHRRRGEYRYRGPDKRLPMGLDCIGKLLQAALWLRQAPEPVCEEELLPAREEIYPHQDKWIAFDDGLAGVWMYRNRMFGFQMPVVSYERSDNRVNDRADYRPSPKSPGLFENPVDSPHLGWEPMLFAQNRTWLIPHLPSAVEKTQDCIRLTYQDWFSDGQCLKGHCAIKYEIRGCAVRLKVEAECEAVVDFVAIQIAESRRRLEIESGETSAGWHSQVVEVEGMAELRSYWNEIRRCHEYWRPGVRDFHIALNIRPVPTVLCSMAAARKSYYYGSSPGFAEPVETGGMREAGLKDIDVLHVDISTEDALNEPALRLIRSCRATTTALLLTFPSELSMPMLSNTTLLEVVRRADAIVYYSSGNGPKPAPLPFEIRARQWFVSPAGNICAVVKEAVQTLGLACR